MAKIKRIPVESSNIKSIGYDESTRTLEVEFKTKQGKTNGVYQYNPVTASAYQELMLADSHGKWLHANIRNNPLVDVHQIQ